MQKHLWAPKARRHRSEKEKLEVLLTSRDPVASSVTFALLDDEAGMQRQKAEAAARGEQCGLGVDQLGAGRASRRLRGGQRRRRLAAQHRGRGVRGGPRLLRGVRRRAGPRPGHRPQPRGPARTRPTSSAPCSPTAAGWRAWCSRGRSSGTTTRHPARTPSWSGRAGDRPLPGAPSPPAGRGPPRPRGPASTARPGGLRTGERPATRPR